MSDVLPGTTGGMGRRTRREGQLDHTSKTRAPIDYMYHQVYLYTSPPPANLMCWIRGMDEGVDLNDTDDMTRRSSCRHWRRDMEGNLVISYTRRSYVSDQRVVLLQWSPHPADTPPIPTWTLAG